MSKPNHKLPQPKPKSFYQDDEVSLFTLQSGSMITGFRAVFKKKTVDVKVRRGKILEAFKKFEKHPLIKKL
jgi:hypothetical protein